MRCWRVSTPNSTPNSRNAQFQTCFSNSVSKGNKISLTTCWTTWCAVAGADPGILDGGGGGPNFRSEGRYWTFSRQITSPPTTLPHTLTHTPHTPSHQSWEGRDDYVFLNLWMTGRRWRGKYCFASRGEQIIAGYPKTIIFLNIPGI